MLRAGTDAAPASAARARRLECGEGRESDDDGTRLGVSGHRAHGAGEDARWGPRRRTARPARGRVLALCDADDRVAEDWVEQAHRAVTAETPMVAGLIRVMTRPLRPDGPVLNPGILHGRGAMSGNAAILRSVFVEVGGFDESLPPYGMEDSNLSALVLQAGHRIGPAGTWAVRQAAVRTGRLVGLRTWVRSGRAGEPVYPLLDRQGPARS